MSKVYIEDDSGNCREVESVETAKAQIRNWHWYVTVIFSSAERSDKDDATITNVSLDNYHKYDIVQTD